MPGKQQPGEATAEGVTAGEVTVGGSRPREIGCVESDPDARE